MDTCGGFFLPDQGLFKVGLGGCLRKNWLFAGSLRAGQHAAAVMSLIQSAVLNGHAPYAYLKDVFTRLPTTRHKDIGELLPHNWRPAQG